LTSLALISGLFLQNRPNGVKQGVEWRDFVSGPHWPPQKESNFKVVGSERNEAYHLPTIAPLEIVPLENYPVDPMILATTFYLREQNLILIFPHDENEASLAFDARGGFLFEQPQLNVLNERIAINEDSALLLSHGQSWLQLGRLGPERLESLGTFSLESLAKELLAHSPYKKAKPDVQFDALHSEPTGGKITVWGFNARLSGLPPETLHAMFEIDLTTKVCRLLRTFGEATVADRLSPFSNRQSIAVIDGHFWVPRQNDAQIDVFSLAGDLVWTVPLPLIHEGPAEMHFPDSEARFQVGSVENAGNRVGYFSSLAYISGIHSLGPFLVGVERFNPFPKNPAYQRVLDVFDHRGRLLADNLPSTQWTSLTGRNGLGSALFFKLPNRPWPKPFTGVGEQDEASFSGMCLLVFQYLNH